MSYPGIGRLFAFSLNFSMMLVNFDDFLTAFILKFYIFADTESYMLVEKNDR